VVSRILAFRPARVVERLEPRNAACALSPRDLLPVAAALEVVLPVVRAPIAGVARGALVAAKEKASAIGLALPPAVPAEAWFDAVMHAADELAAGLPIFLVAEVAVDGDGALEVERAVHEAWRLVDAGITHLSLDATAVAPAERARVLAEVAAPALERELGLDVVLPLGEAVRRGGALVDGLRALRVTPDLVGVRCPAPADDEEVRAQLAVLRRAADALGVALLRRGPTTPALLAALAGGPVRACDDGAAAATRALELVPDDEAAGAAGRRESPLERAAGGLPESAADRLEARAYVETVDLVERLGASGSALAIARELERRLDAR
jgi:hypothetical protein